MSIVKVDVRNRFGGNPQAPGKAVTLRGDCRKACLAAKAKENLTQRPPTESNNRKVISMIENIIGGLYLVGDVALLGLLVYNSHKPHNKIKRGSSDIYKSEPIKGLRQQLHGLQGPQGKR
jgi:hypothetical protein